MHLVRIFGRFCGLPIGFYGTPAALRRGWVRGVAVKGLYGLTKGLAGAFQGHAPDPVAHLVGTSAVIGARPVHKADSMWICAQAWPVPPYGGSVDSLHTYPQGARPCTQGFALGLTRFACLDASTNEGAG